MLRNTLILLALTLAVTGCSFSQQNTVPDAQTQDLPDSPTATDQESSAEEQGAQPQNSANSPAAADNESAAEEAQLAANTPVNSANRRPFQFTISTDNTDLPDGPIVTGNGQVRLDTDGPIVIQFDENTVFLEITGYGQAKIKRAVVIRPDKSKTDAQVEIDCESDGTYDFKGDTVKFECSYPPNSGTHQISVRGDISTIELCGARVEYYNCTTKECTEYRNAIARFQNKFNPIVSVDSWGDIQWESMHWFAYNCGLLEKIPEDAPDLSRVNNMSDMFHGAVKFNQTIDHWDVSNVTDMNGMFSRAEAFNQPLEKWNVSNVTNMEYLFSNAESFNQPLEKWNVSNVTNMRGMFLGAKSFNQPLEKWNVSNVTNMEHMFSRADAFNQPLEKWNVSNVTNMREMFGSANAFNQPLNQWTVSNVNDMTEMFREALSFNHYPSSWIVPRGKTDSMFYRTPIEKQAKQNPLKTRKVKK
ncbi:MAG: DUF285 domain-containing protein [Proteobacteria bacterium]|nr:DUF285 domain-containing protein [Pseudomonadota bacterium]